MRTTAISILAALVAAMVVVPVFAEGGAGLPPPVNRPPPRNPDYVRGSLYFDQAIEWINDGKPGVNEVTSFFADLEDVQFDNEQTHQEGYVRLWFEKPDKFRQEWRNRKKLDASTPITTKILVGDQLWVIPPNGVAQRKHGTADGARDIAQLKQDRERMSDLASFLRLEGLKGAGVTFDYQGKTEGSGVYAGKWLKVIRRRAGGGDMIFYLGYETDAAGNVRATYPGVIRVPGDPRKNERSEDFILSRWRSGPQFRYPAKIEAFGKRRPAEETKRFLLAFPAKILVNPILQPVIWADPTAR